MLGLVLLVANIPVYRYLFRVFFGSRDEFREAVKYSFTPDLLSLFRGRYWKDQFGEAKLSFFFFCCVMAVVVEFVVLRSLLLMMF
ncbi:hypothetical protein [Gorillibacterium timonense]|uniref:hypothetical protein n=1 Tax=Gorillibacterium timonense TaxID=1689269 RepID=UPI001F1B33C8|nr:hypothetical protein [Gorillibacterium timonense]